MYSTVPFVVAILLGQWNLGLADVQARYKNATSRTGVNFEMTMSWGSNWVDFDRDGDADLFANRHWRTPRLYENVEGVYELTAETFPNYRPGRAFDRHTCSWGEANGDGSPELYCAAGAKSGRGTGQDQLWFRTRDGFENRSPEYGTEDWKGRTRSVSWLDYDTDGDLDLFLLQKKRKGEPNRMMRNDRGSFKEAKVGLSEEMNGLSATWSDWDRDGDPDLLVTRYTPEPTIAYENVGGTFDKTSIAGITGQHWTSSAWGDYDGDGWTDLQMVGPRGTVIARNVGGEFEIVQDVALASGSSSTWIDFDNDGDLDSFVVQGTVGGSNQSDLLLVNEAHGFTDAGLDSVAGPESGSGESVSSSDHDRDGDLDLFVTNGATLDMESQLQGKWVLWENATPVQGWAGLELVGDFWNPFGYGARIVVELEDGTTYHRELNDGMGLRAQSEVGHQVLGLGSSDGATVRIEWPNGLTDCTQVRKGETTVIRLGTSLCAGQAAS